MKKTKILQFQLLHPKGGGEHYILQNWKHIDKSRFRFDFVVRTPYFMEQQWLLDSGCKLHYIPFLAKDKPAEFMDRMGDILDEGYDVIHLHGGLWTGFGLENLAKVKGCKRIIVHSHLSGCDPEYLERHNFLKAQFSSDLATDFCACSKLAADFTYGGQIPRECIRIMKNAIEVERFLFDNKKRIDVREKFGISDAFVIGHIGRFCHQKNQAFLLAVFDEILKIRPNSYLLLLGAGELELELRSLSADFANKVIFLGEQDDVVPFMQAMDCFVLTSFFEGLPFAAIEAQANGLPCFLSDTISADTQITPNAQFISLSQSARQWAETIVSVCGNFHRANTERYIKAAGYDIREEIHQIERLYCRDD